MTKLQEILENLAGVGKDCKPRITIDQALSQLKALDKIDEGKLEESINNFMAESPDSTVLYFDEVKDLAKALIQRKSEWIG